MAIYSTVACQEVPSSAHEECNGIAGLNVSVRLQCNWTDRFNLVNDLLGTPRSYPKITTGLVPFAISANIIDLPQQGYGTDSDQQICTFDQALVDVNYSAAWLDDANEQLEPMMEAIPLDFNYFNWGTGAGAQNSLLEGEAPPLIFRSVNLVRTKRNISTIPTDVFAAIGCVNEFAYTSTILNGLVFPAGTLLFLPASAQRSFKALASLGFTLSLKFGFKPQGWNTYWRATTQAWEPIYVSGSGSPYLAYPSYDFSALFA